MGSLIEINDTLKISKDRGFPLGLTLDIHVTAPSLSLKFMNREFEFWNNDERLYHRPPTRVFLVEEINGKWLYWGHGLVISQTIEKSTTMGRYKIKKIYDPDFQRRITIEESPLGKSYFDDKPTSILSLQT